MTTMTDTMIDEAPAEVAPITKPRKPRKPRTTKATAPVETQGEAAPVASPPQPPPPPICMECGELLTWRDTAYGRKGRCKGCTQRAARRTLQGAFLPAGEYIRRQAELARNPPPTPSRRRNRRPPVVLATETKAG